MLVSSTLRLPVLLVALALVTVASAATRIVVRQFRSSDCTGNPFSVVVNDDPNVTPIMCDTVNLGGCTLASGVSTKGVCQDSSISVADDARLVKVNDYNTPDCTGPASVSKYFVANECVPEGSLFYKLDCSDKSYKYFNDNACSQTAYATQFTLGKCENSAPFLSALAPGKSFQYVCPTGATPTRNTTGKSSGPNSNDAGTIQTSGRVFMVAVAASIGLFMI